MKNLVLAEKWRPKTLDEVILPNRIREYFKNGLESNVICYGHWGTGKTTVARILIGKYTKANPYLEINTSLYTSIDVLREKVSDFCKSQYISMESDNNIDYIDKIKYVFLDEFDRASKQYQDALKGFIEDMSAHYNVRFIFVTNHIDRISDGIKSRMTAINFDSINAEEQKEMKVAFCNKIINTIIVEEGIDISKKDVAQIINTHYPDFRKTLNSLQDFKNNKETVTNTANGDLKNKTYEIILKKDVSYKDVYDFVFINFGDAGIGDLMKILGRDFINYVMKFNLDSSKLFEANSIVVDMQSKLQNTHDPLIVGIATIGEIRKLYIQ